MGWSQKYGWKYMLKKRSFKVVTYIWCISNPRSYKNSRLLYDKCILVYDFGLRPFRSKSLLNPQNPFYQQNLSIYFMTHYQHFLKILLNSLHILLSYFVHKHWLWYNLGGGVILKSTWRTRAGNDQKGISKVKVPPESGTSLKYHHLFPLPSWQFH